MKFMTNVWSAAVPTLATVAIVLIGCSQDTTRKDVAKAHDTLQKEQQQTADAIHQGKQDLSDAERRAQDYTAAKPVTTDQIPTADQTKVADAQLTAAERVAKQKEQERAAAANVTDKEQQFQMTQARDAYVKDIDQKLADTDKQIDSLKQKASNAQGADKDAIDRQVEMLKTQRDMAQKALNDLKSAEIASWKNHQEQVRLALQDLDKSMKNIR